MKLEYTFLHVDSSDALVSHFENRLAKLVKFELKPMDIHVIFSMERHVCYVDVTILEGRRKFKATGDDADFYRAVDKAVNKLHRQMAKDRRRLREHRNPEASDAGKMARLTETLEHDYSRAPLRKAV